MSPSLIAVVAVQMVSAVSCALSQVSMSKAPSLSDTSKSPRAEKAKTWVDEAEASCLTEGDVTSWPSGVAAMMAEEKVVFSGMEAETSARIEASRRAGNTERI